MTSAAAFLAPPPPGKCHTLATGTIRNEEVCGNSTPRAAARLLGFLVNFRLGGCLGRALVEIVPRHWLSRSVVIISCHWRIR